MSGDTPPRSPTPRSGGKAGKVLVTRADGTQSVEPAYGRPQLRRVVDGKTPTPPNRGRKRYGKKR